MSLKSKFLTALIVIAYLLFISLSLGGFDDYAKIFASAILPLIAVLYTISVKKKPLFFSLFVYLFALSDFAILFSNYIPSTFDYYSGNLLYMVSYSCLLVEILRTVNFSSVWQNFRFHLIVLASFSFYALYELQDILISRAAHSTFEFIYNGILVGLLCSAIINYFYRDDKKSLFLLIGSAFLVSYEIIAIAYLYLANESTLLNIISTTFLVVAFYFLYYQIGIKYSRNKQSNYIINNPE